MALLLPRLRAAMESKKALPLSRQNFLLVRWRTKCHVGVNNWLVHYPVDVQMAAVASIKRILH